MTGMLVNGSFGETSSRGEEKDIGFNSKINAQTIIIAFPTTSKKQLLMT